MTKIGADLWAVNIYGPSIIMAFEQAALPYAEDGREARYLFEIYEHFSGMTLNKINPQTARAAAKNALSNFKVATKI